jgi:GTP-binding protein YchF
MVRVFDMEDIVHVEGDVDPIRDLEIIFEELILKDLSFVDKEISKLTPIVSRGIDKSKKQDLEYLHKIKETLEARVQIRCAKWNGKEIEYLNTLHLLTAKPAAFLVNMSEKDYLRQKNKHLLKVKEWIAEKTGEPFIPFSCEVEKELVDLSPAEVAAYCAEKKTRSQITNIITTGFHSMNLIYFFTSGTDEVKCWTVQKGWKAPQAAGRIHTDFEKGFICADVIHYADFADLQSESKCRDEGKQHQEGKTYEVLDGDIILFKFNVSKGGKK